jgi:hypothetical protein
MDISIEKEIKYYEKLFSFYKPHQLDVEDIIAYTKLLEQRNALPKKEESDYLITIMDYLLEMLYPEDKSACYIV